jgi:hypothetical protein
LFLKGLAIYCVAVSFSLAAPEVRNLVVYSQDDKFAGWPANEGIWSWGGEILTAFEVASFVETDGDHSVDRNSPKEIMFARSLDGGETWTAEAHPEIGLPDYIGDEEKFRQQREGERIPVPSPGGFDLTHPGFAMKLRGGSFYVSQNRGRRWEGPYQLPGFDYASEARTSYIVTGKSSCIVFMTARVTRRGATYSRSCALETTDGTKTFRFLSWIGGDILDAAGRRDDIKGKSEVIFSIMPSAVKLTGGRFICALRQRFERAKWTDIYESTDNCRTWRHLGVLEKGGGNPVSLLALQDGSVAAIYCSRRNPPFGLAAKISQDNGAGWSKEIVLRKDARKWDIGYTRAAPRPDGGIVIVYYYTTKAIPNNHIAATIWHPAR